MSRVLKQEEQKEEGGHTEMDSSPPGKEESGTPAAPEPRSAAPRGQGWFCEGGLSPPGSGDPRGRQPISGTPSEGEA